MRSMLFKTHAEDLSQIIRHLSREELRRSLLPKAKMRYIVVAQGLAFTRRCLHSAVSQPPPPTTLSRLDEAKRHLQR